MTNDTISRSALLAAYDAAHKGPPGGARKLIEEAPVVIPKEQEPRLISGDAIVAHLGGPLWLETKNNRLYTGWTLAYDIQRGMGITGTRLGLAQPGGHVMWLKLDDYGRTWRCWTACPNEERREATAWPYK